MKISFELYTKTVCRDSLVYRFETSGYGGRYYSTGIIRQKVQWISLTCHLSSSGQGIMQLMVVSGRQGLEKTHGLLVSATELWYNQSSVTKG
jgi:hypothetical protein